MDLYTIAKKTGLPSRTVRYVIEQDLVPNLTYQLKEKTAGRPRILDQNTAVAVAAAAWLLQLGLKKATVKAVLERASVSSALRGKRQIYRTLADLIASRTPCVVTIADGRFLRLSEPGGESSPWIALDPQGTGAQQVNAVGTVQLDLGRVMQQLAILGLR